VASSSQIVIVMRREWLIALKRAHLAGLTPSAVLFLNATPSVFHQRHIGRVLRSSCNHTGRRLASSRG
jgi:hypothetical protein